jgi:hypothetical protein
MSLSGWSARSARRSVRRRRLTAFTGAPAPRNIVTDESGCNSLDGRPVHDQEFRYARLDSRKITATAQRLADRIERHFPSTGLAAVAAEVASLANICAEDAVFLSRPNLPVRALVAATLLAGVGLLAAVASGLDINVRRPDALLLVQVLESAMNIAVLVGLGLVTVTRLEANRKKRRALDSLHRLRSLAHVIDMHQLTKHPGGATASPSEQRPRPALSPEALERYLDYCSEMLSLIGKYAALYAQSLQDSVVVDAVNDIENLTTNLARKIWQKIAIIDRQVGEARKALPGP